MAPQVIWRGLLLARKGSRTGIGGVFVSEQHLDCSVDYLRGRFLAGGR